MEPRRPSPTRDGTPHAGAAIGLDIGTSGARALVVSAYGEVMGEGQAEYGLISERPGYAEQDPEEWWRGAVAAIRAAVAQAGVRDVVAIGLSGQMHGAVLLDADLRPMRSALLWCDARAADDAAAVAAELTTAEVLALAGNVPAPGFTGPQLRWLGRHGSLAGARWVVCAKDFVRLRLTGEVATDPSDASGTGLLGVDGAWSPTLARAYGVDAGLLAPVVESGAPAGTLTRAAADAVGLVQGIPVAAGAADNAAAALGAGVTDPGVMLVSLGTSGTLVVPVREPRVDPTGSCHLFRHAVPGTWYSMPVVLNAGGALAWWGSVTGAAMDDLAAAAAAVRPGSDGVVMLPFLSGRRMPVLDPHARAGFAGMSLAHGLPHLTRATIEGAGHAMTDGLACLRALGFTEISAVLTGGASRHAIWREVMGLALPELTLSEAVPAGGAALGAALLGFSATGVPLTDLAGRIVRHQAIPAPEAGDAGRAAVRAGYEAYRTFAESQSSTSRRRSAT